MMKWNTKPTGARIRDAREAAGLTQEELAGKIRLSAREIAELEQEKIPLTLPVALRMANVLETSEYELLFGCSW